MQTTNLINIYLFKKNIISYYIKNIHILKKDGESYNIIFCQKIF